MNLQRVVGQVLLWSLLLVDSATSQQEGGAGLKIPQDGYDKEFYEQHLDLLPTYEALAEVMLGLMTYTGGEQKRKASKISVVDVGCGAGLLVEAFRNLGVKNSFGVDSSVSAVTMWPPRHRKDFYKRKDLADEENAWQSMPPTEFVVSFETAEHLPEASASHFVRLLSTHRPRKIFFGAATEFQDQGRNPTHVNEQSLSYWVERFEHQDYVLDAASSAKLRHLIMNHPKYRLDKGWWFPKNFLVFVDALDSPERSAVEIDAELFYHMNSLPPGAEGMIEKYASMMEGAHPAMAELWSRDWTEFGRLFQRAKDALYGFGNDEL